MAKEYHVRYSYVIMALIKSHLASTLFVFYAVFGVIAIVSMFKMSGEEMLQALLYALVIPLYLIPYSFAFAFPSLIIAVFVSVKIMRYRSDNLFIWLVSALFVGLTYLMFSYDLYGFLLFSIPVSFLNGILMRRMARRYYEAEEVK